MKQLASNIRYGVVANIAVSHTAAGGSIPPIGVSFSSFYFLFSIFFFFLFAHDNTLYVFDLVQVMRISLVAPPGLVESMSHRGQATIAF